MSLFSVIVPTFNRADLLSGTLESVFGQRFTDFEIIVVDDGSTDGTINYLQSLGNRIRVFQQPNLGAGPARNLGARHAQGRYLAFLDSDDLWFPWTLGVYRDVIRAHGDPSFIAGKPHLFSGTLELEKVVCGAMRVQRFVDYFASGDELRWWGASSLVIRQDAFQAVGGFTEEWVNDEDLDLTLQLGLAPGFIQVTSPETFAYRRHASNVSKDSNRLLAGTRTRIRAECEGRYPGGNVRAMERRRILTRSTRSISIGCIKAGLLRDAWMLYCATFGWNLSLRRVKYLLAFPVLAVVAMAGRYGRARIHAVQGFFRKEPSIRQKGS